MLSSFSASLRELAPAKGGPRVSSERVCLRRKLPCRVVGDRGPCAHVLGVTTKLFKSERAIGPGEDVDASVNCCCRRTLKNLPRGIEASRHAANLRVVRFPRRAISL